MLLRSLLKRVSLPAPRSIGAGPIKRRFGEYAPGKKFQLPKVPVLRPTLWAITATATIYIGCATYNVYREVRTVKRRGNYSEDMINSYDDLLYAKTHGSSFHRTPSHTHTAAARWFPTGHLSAMLSGYTDAQKFILCVSALNISLVGASSLAPSSVEPYFYHIPALSPNYTLLTSAFGHAGLFHAAVNTFALLQFAPAVARSPLFEGNGGHFAAFYLSAGIFSSLGHHLGTILPTRRYHVYRLGPASGASGAIMALVGAWATMNPDGQMGIIFLPFSFSASELLAFTAAFETYGLFFGVPFVSFAHAAHLSGLAIGWAYTHFDGNKRLWHPACQSAFLLMKRLKMI